MAPPLIIFNLPSTWGPGKQWRFSGNAIAAAAGLICRQQGEEESEGESESRLGDARSFPAVLGGGGGVRWMPVSCL